MGGLLKGEVLGSRNAKRTNNLIIESVKAYKLGVGVDAMYSQHGVHGTGGVRGTDCYYKSRLLWDNPSRRPSLTALQDTDLSPSYVSPN